MTLSVEHEQAISIIEATSAPEWGANCWLRGGLREALRNVLAAGDLDDEMTADVTSGLAIPDLFAVSVRPSGFAVVEMVEVAHRSSFLTSPKKLLRYRYTCQWFDDWPILLRMREINTHGVETFRLTEQAWPYISDNGRLLDARLLKEKTDDDWSDIA